MAYRFEKVVKTQKGGTIVPVVSDKGADVTWLLADELTVPWAPSNMSDPESSRLNMCFHATDQMEKLCAALDSWVVAELNRNSEKLLGKKLSPEQVAAMYQPSLKTSNKGCRHLKTKLQLGNGRSCTTLWGQDGIRCDVTENWCDCTFQAKIVESHLYVMPKECDFVLQIKDLLMKSTETMSPSAGSAADEKYKKWLNGTRGKKESGLPSTPGHAPG